MGKRTDKTLKGGINSATSRAGDDCCKFLFCIDCFDIIVVLFLPVLWPTFS